MKNPLDDKYAKVKKAVATPSDGSRLPSSALTKADVAGDPEAEARLVKRGLSPVTRMRPHIGALLDMSYAVLAGEMRTMMEKTEVGEVLSDKESRKVHSYVDSICKLAREEREQEKREVLESLTDEELAALAEKALPALRGGGDDSEE